MVSRILTSDRFEYNNFVYTYWFHLSRLFLDITLMSADEADSLQEASMELLSDEDLVVEFLDLKDEGKFPKKKKTREYKTEFAVQQYFL